MYRRLILMNRQFGDGRRGSVGRRERFQNLAGKTKREKLWFTGRWRQRRAASDKMSSGYRSSALDARKTSNHRHVRSTDYDALTCLRLAHTTDVWASKRRSNGKNDRASAARISAIERTVYSRTTRPYWCRVSTTCRRVGEVSESDVNGSVRRRVFNCGDDDDDEDGDADDRDY